MSVDRAWRLGLGGVALLGVMAEAGEARAHFILQSPAAMTEQNELGDPQKAPNCGDPGDATLTGEVTAYTAGDTVTITIDERIYHPGHYRVALALNDASELPPAPAITPTPQDECASTVIQDPPVFPVLADGMLAHEGVFEGPQTFEVTLPDDVSCENCTLQVIQYMSSHGAPCFYYHCATISIAPSSSSGDSSGGPVGTTDDETASTTDAPDTSSTTSDGSGDSNSGSATSDPTTSTPTSGDATATASGGVATVGDQGGDDDDGGCSVGARGGAGSGAWMVLAGLGLLSLRRRRAPASSRSRPPSRR